MGEQMPKEQQEYIERIEKHVLEASNISKDEAYTFAFRCWQLGYDRSPRLKDKIYMELLQKEDIFTNDLVFESRIPKSELVDLTTSIAQRVEEMVVKEVYKSLPVATITAMLNSKYGNPTTYSAADLQRSNTGFGRLNRELVSYDGSVHWCNDAEVKNALQYPTKDPDSRRYIITQHVQLEKTEFDKLRREYGNLTEYADAVNDLDQEVIYTEYDIDPSVDTYKFAIPKPNNRGYIIGEATQRELVNAIQRPFQDLDTGHYVVNDVVKLRSDIFFAMKKSFQDQGLI